MKIREVLYEMYSAYLLPAVVTETLLKKFPPRYEKVLAHHVTVEFGGDPDVPEIAELKIAGHVDSGDGLEALVVSVNGETARPDGSTYHITWSIDPASDYTPKDSNALLAKKRYTLIIPVPFEAAAVVLN